MNREEAKALLPIIQAFAEGKTIQSKQINTSDKEWKDIEECNFLREHSYRTKPESKYRPFNTAEECWKEMHLHDDFPWIKHVGGEFTQIKNIGKYEIKVEYSEHCIKYSNYSFNLAFNEFKFTDGTPFGIKEE